MFSSGRLALVAVLTALQFPLPAAGAEPAREQLRKAAADPALRDALIREGRKASFFCANCHGEAGLSRFPEVPNLAGQNPAYLVSQIDAFVGGKRRNPFMEGLMKVLPERDKAAIASYFAASGVVPAVQNAGPRAREGGEHYQRLCARCHGPDGHGAESSPRLAGQQPEYLRVSLRRYLAKTAPPSSPDKGAAITQLGDGNVDPIVEYLASLK